MWALKSSKLGADPSQTMIAPSAMWPFCLSLSRNDVSNDVNLSIWPWVIYRLLYLAQGSAYSRGSR